MAECPVCRVAVVPGMNEPEITNEMVERAAQAIQEAESAADATAYNTGSWFFTAAHAALTVAFREEQADG